MLFRQGDSIRAAVRAASFRRKSGSGFDATGEAAGTEVRLIKRAAEAAPVFIPNQQLLDVAGRGDQRFVDVNQIVFGQGAGGQFEVEHGADEVITGAREVAFGVVEGAC
jgi:hypothetical protein